MDDNCGEWVECIGVASGCGERGVGVASGSEGNLWVWLAGGGCEWNLWVWLKGGIKISSYYLFLLFLYLFFFAAASLLFVHCFSFLFQNFFVIKLYVRNKILVAV